MLDAEKFHGPRYLPGKYRYRSIDASATTGHEAVEIHATDECELRPNAIDATMSAPFMMPVSR
jgi:hypothetical protein